MSDPLDGPGEGAPLDLWEGAAGTSWEARWGIPRFEAWDRLPSTNDRVRALAAEGAPAWSVVVADVQTAGRGRRGRVWHSPPGGLWMSLLLRPPGGDAALRLLPLLVGLAVARAVEHAAPGLRAGLKWPNDVLVDGAKVAGVLCEGVGGGAVVAGVGIDVDVDPGALPADVTARAASLAQVAGRPLARANVAGAVVAEARRLLDRATPRLDGPLADELRSRDVLRGHRVRTDAGLEGVAAGVGPDGALLVEGPDGRRESVVAGSVRRA